MKKTVQSKWLQYAMLHSLAMMAGTVALAADTPAAGGWTVAATVGSPSAITMNSGGAAITIAFAKQGQPPDAFRCDVLVGGAGPSSVFTGNLTELGYSGIRLKINGSGQQPEEASVLIRRILSQYPFVYRDWRYSGLTVSSNPGDWTIADIPLRRLAGWKTAGQQKFSEETLDSWWESDLANIGAMYLRLQSGGVAAQSYSVSDFQLMGEGVISEAANLSPLQHYFGVSSLEGLSSEELATLMARDADGDGMSDYHEILAGFNPGNASSSFMVRVAVDAEGNTVSWDGVLGKKYAVWRSNDLRGGFTAIAAKIECKATGAMTYNDNSPVAGTANFYKVVNY